MTYDDKDFSKEDYKKFKVMLEQLSKDNDILEKTKAVVTPLNELDSNQGKNDRGEK